MTATASPIPATAHDDPLRWRRVGRWLYAVVPPLVAYLFGHVIFWVAAARDGFDYLSAASHYRYDSVHYSSIANSGYELFRCADRPDLAAWGPDAWCGNAGWFPLYPWSMRVVRSVTGLTTSQAGWLVTELAGLAIVVVLWWLLARLDGDAVTAADRARRLAVLALAVVVPAGVYFHAIFPMSLAAAAMLGYAALLTTGRWVWAGLAGAVATMAYPTGGLVAVVGLVVVGVLVWRWQFTASRALAALAAVCGLPALALLGVLVFMQSTMGHWDAYLKVGAKYSDQGHNPVDTFVHVVTEPSSVEGTLPPMVARLYLTLHLEMWATLALVLLACAGAVAARVRGRLEPVDAGLAAFAVLMFVAPLAVGSHVSQYRAHTLLLPAIVLLRHLPGWLLWLLAVALLPLAYRMGTLFYPSLLL